ncbi:MAG TPA: nicotinate-nucleotide adenylyltransferase [Pyrinomonadaceae bacterium]|nr:nicotinate-nucleotide adenylyltransferase [Pyrinomonadaceae bacterium]
MNVKRIALYGGTFDPVHNGHMSVARALLQLFSLDEVVFIPAHVAPHKREQFVSPALMRYAMLALATNTEARMRVSTFELDAPERPYTVETLARMKEKYGTQAHLFFVMGADSWTDIRTWREWERVLTLTNHIVMARPGYELDAAHVTNEIRESVVDLRGADADEITRAASQSDVEKIYVTDAVQMDISATQVRRLVQEDMSQEWTALVPHPVAEFIEKYRLYRDKA